MTTPEQARKLAEFKGTDDLPCNVRDALRDLAQQVEELQADAERLDILQKYPSAVYHLRACWYSRRFDGHRQHETLRDAIDAVREVKK